MRSERRPRADRLLVCGLIVPPGRVGGLQLAISHLASGLESLGWSVDLAITPDALGIPLDDHTRDRLASWTSPRWSRLPRMHFVRGDTRRLLQHAALDGGAARVHSRAMSRLAARLRERPYDAVLAVVGHMIPGFARFVTSAHPNVVLVSLDGLAFELRARRRLEAIRLSAKLRCARLDPLAYRAVDTQSIRSVVFASESWKRQAVNAGLPSDRAETIYFGIATCPKLEPLGPVGNRLLWVGRASREKGLHHFIEAVACLRRSMPVTLTAICAQGPGAYRGRLRDLIERHALQDAVRLLPPVPHSELPQFYRTHDTLLFDSPFAEPVALVVLEAFAHGLPVVARASANSGPLLVPGSTCEAFRSSDPREIAEAVSRSLRDTKARDRMRTAAYEIVAGRFSMAEAARRYDAVLRRAMRRPDGAGA
jgi:glycosyltransferase involved in cell wall biosynthesis